MASSKKQSGLGRGLGALIPQNFDTMAFIEDGERVRQIAVSDLKPNAEQPRTVFDKAALEELAASILEHGIVQPLVVSPQGEGYIIIAGERRYRAAKLAKLKKVPALVRTSEQLEQLGAIGGALVEHAGARAPGEHRGAGGHDAASASVDGVKSRASEFMQ